MAPVSGEQPAAAAVGDDPRPPADARRGAAAPSVADTATRLRAAALAVRVPLVDRLRYWTAFIALARRGTPVYSPALDAQYADGPLKRRYERALERIDARLAALDTNVPAAVPAFRPHELTAADHALLTRLAIPYILRGAAVGLPAMGWTLESLEAEFGDCTGPINEAHDRPSDDLDRPTKAHHYYDFRIGTLREVCESIRRGGSARFVVGEDIMHARGGRLRAELELPHWERFSGWERNRHHWLRSRLCVGKVFSAQLLVQPEGAYSLWHTEGGDNFFVLTRGRKVWTLAHPRYSASFRPRVKKTTNYTGSNIDVRESDDVQRRRGFAGYPGVPKVRAELEAGDMLRVPAFWWHTVETTPGDYTIAASLRIEPGPSLEAAGLLTMRLLDEQAHAMMKAYARDGRISDELIGQPRRSRSVAGPG